MYHTAFSRTRPSARAAACIGVGGAGARRCALVIAARCGCRAAEFELARHLFGELALYAVHVARYDLRLLDFALKQ